MRVSIIPFFLTAILLMSCAVPAQPPLHGTNITTSIINNTNSDNNLYKHHSTKTISHNNLTLNNNPFTATYTLVEGDAVALPDNVTLRFAASGENATFLLGSRGDQPHAGCERVRARLHHPARRARTRRSQASPARRCRLLPERGPRERARHASSRARRSDTASTRAARTVNVTLSFVGTEAERPDRRAVHRGRRDAAPHRGERGRLPRRRLPLRPRPLPGQGRDGGARRGEHYCYTK